MAFRVGNANRIFNTYQEAVAYPHRGDARIVELTREEVDAFEQGQRRNLENANAYFASETAARRREADEQAAIKARFEESNKRGEERRLGMAPGDLDRPEYRFPKNDSTEPGLLGNRGGYNGGFGGVTNSGGFYR